jgi:hypothetical protein
MRKIEREIKKAREELDWAMTYGDDAQARQARQELDYWIKQRDEKSKNIHK